MNFAFAVEFIVLNTFYLPNLRFTYSFKIVSKRGIAFIIIKLHLSFDSTAPTSLFNFRLLISMNPKIIPYCQLILPHTPHASS